MRIFTIVRAMNYAYDCHMHLLPLNHVCLSAYLEYASGNPISEAYAQVSARDYVVSGILRKQGEVRNLVAVMEHTVEGQLALYEDDLKGIFAHNENDAVITENGIRIQGTGKSLFYDRLIVCPLLMDFSVKKPLNVYYPHAPEHNIETQAAEVLEGIKRFHAQNPSSLLEVRPFIGINPLNYSASFIDSFLNKVFLSHKLLKKPRSSFAGVKVYPPMGFDPDPPDASKKDAVEALYTFCETHHIPIVTHCDDQGFRLTPLEESFLYTSPERWDSVLKRHPDLCIDFAHFGEQYFHAPLSRFSQKTAAPSWREKILSFMQKYPNVYADLSFDGVQPVAWENMCRLLQDVPAGDRGLYEERLLFGTDWPLSLAKTQSAFAYWRGFADSTVSSQLADRMLHINPERFLSFAI